MEIQNSKDWAKVYRACGFIEKGVCEYADERVYLSEETLIKSLHTIKGRPVIIDHMTGITPENMNKHAVGYVVDYEVQGACDCKFVIFDDEGKKVIADGYSVSCAYKPKSFGPGGTWHNVPYDREITDLEYTHLALVQNPRYEDAKVYENAKDEKGKWITIKGTHVFIKDGQSVEDAMKDTFKSSPTEKKEKGGKQKEKDDLKGKYAKEDANFNIKQLKKDIDEAQSLGYEEVEDIAEFLGLDEDEVRETIGSENDDQNNNINSLIERFDLNFKDELSEEQQNYLTAIIDATKKQDIKELNSLIERFDLNFGDELSEEQSDYWKHIVEASKGSGSSFDEEGFKKFVKGNKKKEKHNSAEQQLKEENMKVDEFFNKMGEMIEEKLNACKSKMNKGDEEEREDDDDKFEMDGKVYSKKELVNAWKEKKNAEESEKKSDEESEEESKKKSDEDEKQNSSDEFFNAMEKRMQQQANANDKIEIYSQAKGLEKGRSIYTK